MRKALVVAAALLAAMIYVWKDRAPQPAKLEPVPVIEPTAQPTFEPLEPIKPPISGPIVHWGSCDIPNRASTEDAALKAVLASTIQTDPLFGGTMLRMEAASCAAYRDRIAGR